MMRLLCWLLRGHNERRLGKNETLDATPEVLELVGRGGAPDRQSVRICRRCGATRLARQRKAKGQATA